MCGLIISVELNRPRYLWIGSYRHGASLCSAVFPEREARHVVHLYHLVRRYGFMEDPGIVLLMGWPPRGRKGGMNQARVVARQLGVGHINAAPQR